LYLLMGISSHPPREFSLTSAGTKSPGQVRFSNPGKQTADKLTITV
jgi:hypothetical protein